MSNIFSETRHPGRRKEDQETDCMPHGGDYFDLRGNQGNIFIIPSGDIANVLNDAEDNQENDSYSDA